MGKTEQWIQRPAQEFGVRRDLFGWIDMLAIKGGRTVGIQACARTGLSPHRKKILETPEITGAMRSWLAPGSGREAWLVGTDWKKSGRCIIKRFACERVLRGSQSNNLLVFMQGSLLDPF